MNQVAPLAPIHNISTLIIAAGDRASLRFLEFFAANIRNPHTRRAYGRAVADFLAWYDEGVAARFVQNCTRSLFSPIPCSRATVGYEQDVNPLSHYTPGKIALVLHDEPPRDHLVHGQLGRQIGPLLIRSMVPRKALAHFCTAFMMSEEL